jgi:hypothetical protein
MNSELISALAVKKRGFGYVEETRPEEINARHFKNRKDGL